MGTRHSSPEHLFQCLVVDVKSGHSHGDSESANLFKTAVLPYSWYICAPTLPFHLSDFYTPTRLRNRTHEFSSPPDSPAARPTWKSSKRTGRVSFRYPQGRDRSSLSHRDPRPPSSVSVIPECHKFFQTNSWFFQCR